MEEDASQTFMSIPSGPQEKKFNKSQQRRFSETISMASAGANLQTMMFDSAKIYMNSPTTCSKSQKNIFEWKL